MPLPVRLRDELLASVLSDDFLVLALLEELLVLAAELLALVLLEELLVLVPVEELVVALDEDLAAASLVAEEEVRRVVVSEPDGVTVLIFVSADPDVLTLLRTVVWFEFELEAVLPAVLVELDVVVVPAVRAEPEEVVVPAVREVVEEVVAAFLAVEVTFLSVEAFWISLMSRAFTTVLAEV